MLVCPRKAGAFSEEESHQGKSQSPVAWIAKAGREVSTASFQGIADVATVFLESFLRRVLRGAGLRRGDLDGGKANQEAGAGRGVVFDAKGAVMLGDDAAGDGQAEAGTAIFRGEMRKEKFVLVFGRDAVAGVGDFDFDRLAVACEPRDHGNGAKSGALEGFGGIVDKIDDDAANELGVGLHDGKGGGEVALESDAVEAAAKNVERLRGDCVHIGGSEARSREARELRKFVDERFEGLHFTLDEVRAFGNQRGQIGAVFAAARRRGALEMAQQALRRELNWCERVFDFVGDALGDFLPSRSFLRAKKLGDVVDDDDESRVGATGAERADGDGGVMQTASSGNLEFLGSDSHARRAAHEVQNVAGGVAAEKFRKPCR